VTSRQNALLKELRAGFRQSSPNPAGLIAIEGFRVIEEAIHSRLRFSAIVFSESGVSRADRLLSQLKAKVEALRVPDDVFQSLVETASPQGVAALVHAPKFSLGSLLDSINPVLVIVHDLQDPGNLGTIIRSAEAFSAGGILLSGDSVSPFNGKVIRSSAGSIFRLPCVASNFTEFVSTLRERGVRIIGTSSHSGVSVAKADLHGPIAFVIGSEGSGLPRQVAAAVDETVYIPIQNGVESLNAGVAASILLYEAARQRQT
jgi:RNA methyltransferase, TrmH family